MYPDTDSRFRPIEYGQESDLILFSKQLLSQAISARASDIHLETSSDSLRIRLRIDGLLQDFPLSQNIESAALLNRFKLLSELDISERRLPQDGQFTFQHSEQQRYDCRISSSPGVFGEKLVIRLQNPSSQQLDLHRLGLNPQQLAILQRQLQRKQGLILIVGPTGSGKTSTLYAALQSLNQPSRNIVSIEDPVEIPLPGIHQIEVQTKIGLNFSQILRSLLRQDPDVIMIGEIRDPETAAMAIRAAQTGHLVLASLHSANASSSLDRLQNLGLASHELAATVNLILAQRLLRRCSAEGYQGRIGIFELLELSPALREQLRRQASSESIASAAIAAGMQSLSASAQDLVASGLSNQAELQRVLGGSETPCA